MEPRRTPVPDAQVAAWIDDLANPEPAVEGIVALGHAAVGPLCTYLDRGPQLVSQPRELAVRLLARLHDPVAADRLRGLLRDNPLRSLPPALAESEYRVKDAAIAGLAGQLGTAVADDVAFGVRSERLPSALRAAGRLRLHALAPSMTALLADDVLAETAAEALHELRPESTLDVLAAIATWLRAEADTPRTRLALTRAFLWLQAAGEQPPQETYRQALRHPCVPVRAAAALAVGSVVPAAEAEAVTAALAHGALGSDERLAADCRTRLQGLTGLPIEPLVRAWQAKAETDVYGNARSPNPTSRRFLLDILLVQAGVAAASLHRIVQEIPADDLAEALFRWRQSTAPWLPVMLDHPDATVRLAATACLWRYPLPARPPWLAARLGDRDRRVRHKACAVLTKLMAAGQASLYTTDLPARAWWRAPFACLRLLARSARARH